MSNFVTMVFKYKEKKIKDGFIDEPKILIFEYRRTFQFKVQRKSIILIKNRFVIIIA